MATQQLQIVCDSSTLANFKAWAQAVSNWFRTLGYTNTADSGQVNWGTIASVPGSGAFIYEMFQSPDTPTFFVKAEYGNVSGTNCPTLRFSIGTGTNGSGVLTGYYTQPTLCCYSAFTAPSSVTQYECDFSGSASRIGVMMWRNGINVCQQFFAIQRTLSAAGAETATGVTLWCSGGAAGGNPLDQQSIVFGVGLPPGLNLATYSPPGSNWLRGSSFRGFSTALLGTTSAFNGGIPIDLCAPLLGGTTPWGNEQTAVGSGYGPDIAEGVPFTITVYGASKTYMPGRIGTFQYVNTTAGTSSGCLCMEYD